METRKVRVRFAPSPTGGLHLGGVRTALFNYLLAKRSGGDFILRIEDTDRTRYVEGAEEYIINALKWCGIEPNEGQGFGGGPYSPYRQSERKESGIYKKYADKLLEGGHAYYAFDTAEELDAMRKRLEAAKVAAPQYNSVSRQNMRNSLSLSDDEVQKLLSQGVPYVIRLKVPRNEEIRFQDLIRGWVSVQSTQVDDKVLLKSDGMPTYHLAHVVDDIEMKISHVVRGEEWLPSAPAHLLLYRFLGCEEQMPKLAHLPLILKPDGNGKLSKRDKSGLPMFPLNWHDSSTGETYTGYKEHGFFSDAFINMLALLGWNPGTNQEIFNAAELIQLFSLERVNKAGAKFDPEKTKWFNQQYLRNKSEEVLAEMVRPYINSEKPFSKEFLTEFCRLMKEKVYFIHQFWEQGSYFFVRPNKFDQDVISKRWSTKSSMLLQLLAKELSILENFNAAEVELKFKMCCENLDIPPGQLMQLLRVAVSGVGGGPALFEMMALLGAQECVCRLEKAVVLFPKF